MFAHATTLAATTDTRTKHPHDNLSLLIQMCLLILLARIGFTRRPCHEVICKPHLHRCVCICIACIFDSLRTTFLVASSTMQDPTTVAKTMRSENRSRTVSYSTTIFWRGDCHICCMTCYSNSDASIPLLSTLCSGHQNQVGQSPSAGNSPPRCRSYSVKDIRRLLRMTESPVTKPNSKVKPAVVL